MRISKYTIIRKLLFILGAPFSFVWELTYKVRRFCYKYGLFQQRTFAVPIISIGNLSFGGTGKTPFTIWLAQYLAEIDKKTMILTRGYKGELENSHGIIQTKRKLGNNPVVYGDEPLVFAKKLKNAAIVVGKNRSDNLEYYFDRVSPDIVLLDDGHQHLKLNRNLNIVLIDSIMPLSRYYVAPLGYLREGLSALIDADIIVLGHADQVHRQKLDQLKEMIGKYALPKAPIIEVGYRPLGLFNFSFEKKMELSQIVGKDVIAVAGIGSPVAFFDLLVSLGCNLIKKVSFPDHHLYTAKELENLIFEAKAHNAIIITTEKDMVKARRVVDYDRLLYLEIQVDFLSGEEIVKKKVQEVLSQSI